MAFNASRNFIHLLVVSLPLAALIATVIFYENKLARKDAQIAEMRLKKPVQYLPVITPKAVPTENMTVERHEIVLLPTPTPLAAVVATRSSDTPPSPLTIDFMVNTRITSISKFIPLSEEQKQRLKVKFQSDFVSHGTSESESLEDILGKDNVEFFKEQRKKAFDQILKESVEKEVLFVARTLALGQTQEEVVRKIYLEIEDEIKNSRISEKNNNRESKNIMQRMIDEERLRNTLLAEKLKNVLSSEQYGQFLDYQSKSQDMQLWHGE